MDFVDGEPPLARPHHMTEHGKPGLVAEHFKADGDLSKRHGPQYRAETGCLRPESNRPFKSRGT